MSETNVDRAVHLYKMQAHHPEGIAALQHLMLSIAADYISDFPRTPDEKVKYETSNYVSNTIRVIMQKLEEEIGIGARLSETEGEPDNEHSGDHQRRRT